MKAVEEDFLDKMENKKIEEIKPKILKILKRYGVKKAGIFGSYARGEQKKNSDIDLLVEINKKNFSLLDLIELEMELEKILKRKVDLLTYNGISPYLKKSIMDNEVKII